MAKKTSTPKPAAPEKISVKPTAKTKPAAKEPVTLKVAPAKTAAPKAKPATPKIAAAPKKAPAFTADDISLRAYFIAEKRRAAGLPGDEHQDWIEAERQLTAESKAPKKSKKS